MFLFPVYCLTLPEEPERHARAAEHFKQIDLPVRFVRGIHADRFGIRPTIPWEKEYKGFPFPVAKGSLGNYLSHYMLWTALNLMGDEYSVVLESDALFCEGWYSRFLNALHNVPKDFDLLFLGSCCCEDKPKTLIAAQVHEVKYPFCSHAYVVARKALPLLLEKHRRIDAPIDVSMTVNSMPFLKTYTVLPRIVDQFGAKKPE